MSRRSPETLADYLVVAIAPLLIALLVGSLMWFLVEVFYQGEYKGRLLWIMAMFVIAIVGIARISIEQGLAYASMFGWALAAAIALALVRLVGDGLFLCALIMILVWWAAHKLTWDCTVIDEDQDVSGQGLLEQMGLDPAAVGQTPLGTSERSDQVDGTTITRKPGEHWQDASATPAKEHWQDASATRPPWWETFLEPDRRPHAPGVWVVYFSLAALPLFGVGGWFVPAGEPSRRALVFGLLVIYVASGMGLLLATSFLGLRRYLRQRKLEMPLEMASTWILVGIGMIFATLIVAAILPRPSREYSLSQLPFTVTSAVRRASQFALGKEGTKDESAKTPATNKAKEGQTTARKGDKGGQSEAGQKQDSSPNAADQQQRQSGSGQSRGKSGEGKGSGESGKPKANGGGGGDKGGKSQGGESKSGESKGRGAESQANQKGNDTPPSKRGEQQKEPREDHEQQQDRPQDQATQRPPPADNPAQPPPPSKPAAGQIMSQVSSLLGNSLLLVIKWLFYGALVVGLFVTAWIYRDELQAAWQKLMDELRELWDWWFGNKKAAELAAAAMAEPIAPPRTFASYNDPFASGDAHGMSWPQLVRYTFEALEAWGRERSCPRDTGQTPHEFAQALAHTQPQVASGAQLLAGWYGQLAYSPKAAVPGSLEPLRQLWTALGAK